MKVISTYPFSQLILHNLFQRPGASLQLDIYPAKASNAGDGKIMRTEGGATLGDFCVARRSQSLSSRLASRFVNSPKVAIRQLRKEGK